MALIKNSTPRFEQIADQLDARIRNGQIVKQLPTRDALATEFSVNAKTIDRAMQVLESRRMIERRRGVGVFVHPSVEGVIVNEFYFVFPGHASMLAASNPWHRLVVQGVAQIFTISRELMLEPRLLPICPDNDPTHLDMGRIQHLNAGDFAVFLGSEYRNVIRTLAKRKVQCLIAHSGGDEEMCYFPKLPVRMFDIDYEQLFSMVITAAQSQGCKHLGAIGTTDYASSVSLLTLLRRHATRENTTQTDVRFDPGSDIAKVGSLKAAAQNVTHLLETQPNIDALLTFNHFEAQAVLQALDRRVSSKRPRVFCYDTMYHYETAQPNIDLFQHPISQFFDNALRIVSGEIPFERGVQLYAPNYVAAIGESQ